MNGKFRHKGSALILAIFIIALLAAVVMGMLQINTEEIQIMRNQIYAADALAIAEAGLNDAFAELRTDNTFNNNYNKEFAGGQYDVNIESNPPNVIIESTGTSSQGFIARVMAEVTVGTVSPYIIRIDKLSINENSVL
jgi:Tfp pilus assembly protein PilX